MKHKTIWVILLTLAIIAAAGAIPFSPGGDIVLRHNYGVFNATNIWTANITINDTLTILAGGVLTNNSIINANSSNTSQLSNTSEYWDGLNTPADINMSQLAECDNCLNGTEINEAQLDIVPNSTNAQRAAIATNWSGLTSSSQITSVGTLGVLDVFGTITAGWLNGPVSWRNLTDYPSACPAGYFVSAINDSITCTLATTSGVTAGNGPYLYNDSSSITLNETVLNTTIDARIPAAAGSSKTGVLPYLFNDSTFMYFNDTMLNLTIDARQITSGEKSGAAPYLFNDSTAIYANETALNVTFVTHENLTGELQKQDACSEISGCNPTAISAVVSDTSPSLGGNLDTNGYNVTLTSTDAYCLNDNCSARIYWNGTHVVIT